MAREIALYLAGAGLGLTAGVDLFWRTLEPNDPDVAVAVLDSEGDPDDRAGSADPAAFVEHPRCLVVVRGSRDAGVEPVAELAGQVYRVLRKIGDDGHDVLDGAPYLDGTAESPYPASADENGRPRYLVEIALTRMGSV